MSDKYFKEALNKVMSIEDQSGSIVKFAVDLAEQVYNEAQALKSSTNSNPRTALRSFMKEYNIEVDVGADSWGEPWVSVYAGDIELFEVCEWDAMPITLDYMDVVDE